MNHRKPTLGDLDLYLAICQTGSLTKAARLRHTSQPAISAGLKRLENLLDTRLIERERKNFSLTEAGIRFREYCETTLRGWSDIREGRAPERIPRARIGFHPSVGAYLLGDFLRTLTQEGFSVEPEYLTGLSRAIRDRIVDRDIDLGWVVNPIPHPDLVIKKIGEDVVTIFGAPGTKSDLLFGDPNLRQTRSLLKETRREKIAKLRFVACDSLEVVRQMTVEKNGFGILPTRVAHLGGPAIRLVEYAKAPRIFDEICVVARADRIRDRFFRELYRKMALPLEKAREK